MAVIDKLFINQFRNLQSQIITPDKQINLFVGANAQGKTNLIEAVYYLGHNRSFKTKNIKEVIGLGYNQLQLQAKISTDTIKIKILLVLISKKLTLVASLAKYCLFKLLPKKKGLLLTAPQKTNVLI